MPGSPAVKCNRIDNERSARFIIFQIVHTWPTIDIVNSIFVTWLCRKAESYYRLYLNISIFQGILSLFLLPCPSRSKLISVGTNILRIHRILLLHFSRFKKQLEGSTVFFSLRPPLIFPFLFVGRNRVADGTESHPRCVRHRVIIVTGPLRC